MKNIIYIFLLAMLVSCEEVLDKKDILGISTVFDNATLSIAYLDKCYVDNLPEWPGVSGYSEESAGTSSIIYGEMVLSDCPSDFSVTTYQKIRSLNILLDEIDTHSLDEATKAPIKAQAYFLRAWRYFNLVRLYGGVPLVLSSTIPADSSVYVSRNKTSECIDQIVADLDLAIANLPATWGYSTDQGRVTRGAAIALKGIVLLYWASPQFTERTQSGSLSAFSLDDTKKSERWAKAYLANKSALDTLTKDGYALYKTVNSSYLNSHGSLWFDETGTNKEAIFIRRYNTTTTYTGWDNGTRPFSASNAGGTANQPTVEMVNTFPMKNGLPITDAASGYDPNLFWKNRDPRFNSTIAYNSVKWQLNRILTSANEWTFTSNFLETTNTSSGFYCRKAVDVTLTQPNAKLSGTDWIEIRLAEVMLNLAECANETGKTQEAYDLLVSIRSRAGIDAGSNNLYGLKENMTKDEMLNTIMIERQIEFAYEGKRYFDLRRRRLYSNLNGTIRHSAVPTVNPTYTVAAVNKGIQDGSIAITDANYNNYFTTDWTKSLETSGKVINFKEEYYFYGIPIANIQKNPNLKQTLGWENGTFDPLQE